MAVDELHTFLFADISGYSALTEQTGDDAAAAVAIGFAREVTRMAAEHGAEIVKHVGDEVIVHATCAAQAVELGLRLRGAVGPGRALPQVHVGIHTGPAIRREGEWWGATVNVASRVADAAEAGQLLITEATRLAVGASRARLTALGPIRFRNISAPVSVYEADCDDCIDSRVRLGNAPPRMRASWTGDRFFALKWARLRGPPEAAQEERALDRWRAPGAAIGRR
jgi:class 3 adenylate cyclase